MNRQTYLDQASLAGFCRESIQLAQALITADDVKEAATRLEADVRGHHRFARLADYVVRHGFLVIVAGAVGAEVLNVRLGEPAPTAAALFASVIASMAVLYLLGSKVDAQDTRVSRLQALQPIAGTDVCEEALKLVQAGHAEALAWRDLAIEERGQLHQFDVAVMRCLEHQITEAQKAAQAVENMVAREAARKQRLDEACRIVHGI